MKHIRCCNHTNDSQLSSKSIGIMDRKMCHMVIDDKLQSTEYTESFYFEAAQELFRFSNKPLSVPGLNCSF